jgi:hypothetical protein
LKEQARQMQQRASLRDGFGEVLPVGTVVQLALDNVDRAKMDFSNATLVVVQHKGVRAYIVANSADVFRDGVARAHLRRMPDLTPKLVELQNVLLGWGGMPNVSIRQIAASLSQAGGQGLTQCNRKGDRQSKMRLPQGQAAMQFPLPQGQPGLQES